MANENLTRKNETYNNNNYYYYYHNNNKYYYYNNYWINSQQQYPIFRQNPTDNQNRKTAKDLGILHEPNLKFQSHLQYHCWSKQRASLIPGSLLSKNVRVKLFYLSLKINPRDDFVVSKVFWVAESYPALMIASREASGSRSSASRPVTHTSFGINFS